MKLWLKLIIFELIYFILFSVLLTVLVYFNVIKANTLDIMTMLIEAINTFVIALIISLNVGKKGLLIGLLIGLVSVGILFTTRILIDRSLDFHFFLKLSIILVSSISAGVLGVNIKK